MEIVFLMQADSKTFNLNIHNPYKLPPLNLNQMLFKNREMFPLTSNEKILREILRSLLIIIFSIILIGILNQNRGIDHDYILVPLVSTVAEIFCILYIINAFTAGNLVRRWANDLLLAEVFNFIQNKKQTSDEKTLELTTKAFGIKMIAVLAIVIFWEVNFYFL